MSLVPTLLYMDDDPAILKMIGRHFTKRGFHVMLAENGREGLELFKTGKPDIVLVDINMPEIDGFEVLKVLTRESPETPVLIISGESDIDNAIKALRYGAWNYHPKPIENFSTIDHAVEQALEKARLIRENRAYQKGLESKLHTIIENFPGFVFTCDKNHHITYANPALLKHLDGYEQGMSCHEAIFGLATNCPWCPDEKHEATEKVTKQEIRNPRDSRWYQAIHSPVFDEEGKLTERQVILFDITERKQALFDLQEKEKALRKENIRLWGSLADRYRFGKMIGKSPPMQEVYETIINAAGTDASVIIYGESGTGKELVAKAIHDHSDRNRKELVYVNCGAIPTNLIESEFFGYKKGAFTGATKDKPGFLDVANGGSIFLDEVGEIPISLQVKLLRAIEGSGYTPVGGTRSKTPDVRIIAATNRDLREAVKQGLMREDFLYRIHIIPIHLPPLRDRKEDIPLLVEHFMGQYDKEKVPSLSPKLMSLMQEYDWPGNVRELQNTIHRFVTLKKLDFMNIGNAPISYDALEGLEFETGDRSLDEIIGELEGKIIRKVLERNGWHQEKTAKELNIGRKTLFRKIKKYAIERPS